MDTLSTHAQKPAQSFNASAQSSFLVLDLFTLVTSDGKRVGSGDEIDAAIFGRHAVFNEDRGLI